MATTKTIAFLLNQTGTSAINTAGWSLYKTNTCLPNATDLLNPPIFQIEGYQHNCLTKGDYLLQISSNFNLNESFYFTLDVKPSEAFEVENDFAIDAHDYGVLNTTNIVSKTLDVGCQSIFDGENTCDSVQYSKSIWQKFITDNHVDFIRFSLGESPLNSANPTNRVWYVNLYEGDISVDSTNLTLVDSCINLQQTAADLVYTDWKCILNPNTTYSIQILFKNDYYSTFTTKIVQHGILPTQGNDPNNLPSNNALGTLVLGNSYVINEHFACNSLTDFYTCGNSTDTIFPALSTNLNPVSWWATFEIAGYANMIITNYASNPPYTPHIQLFSGSIEDSCNLSPVALPFNCLEPGSYSILVTGKGLLENNLAITNLAKPINLDISTTPIYPNIFSLETPNLIDSINNLSPLLPNVVYPATSNSFDCKEDLLPDSLACGSVTKAMYRVIHIDQPGKIEISQGNIDFTYQVFQGDLSTSPIDSNEITGTIPHSCCFSFPSTSSIYKMCIDSGLYTIVTLGNETNIGQSDAITVKFSTTIANPYTNPLFPDVMPSLSLNSLNSIGINSKIDCTINPDTILGLAPCFNNHHVTYKEVRLLDSLSVTFVTIGGSGGSSRLFKGRRSTNSITSLVADCFTSFAVDDCLVLDTGWYTLVTYNPISTPHCANNVGNDINIGIYSEPPFIPLFNTFDKADSVYVEWFPRTNHNDTIPSQWQHVSLTPERFGCLDDLNFPAGINACSPNENRVSYRVLHIKKPSYIFMYSTGINLTHNFYEGDITKLSPPYTLLDSCFNFSKRTCIDSGVYTIATFATDQQIKQTYTFSIYVDSLAHSKYDYAANAYNFGTIPNDGVSYFYNPAIPSDQFADSLNRPASNDFITCSTNSSIDEPNEYCYTPSYFSGNRKTLWYTFELDSPGLCTVNVNTLTPDKRNVSWAIYKTSNNNYPLTDSTANDLTLIRKSVENCSSTNWEDSTQISFSVDACDFGNERYVVIVTNKDKSTLALNEEPNIQVNVSVKLDAAALHEVKYDYYTNANEINGNPTTNCSLPNSNDTLIYGVYSGCSADLTCATKSFGDPISCGENTVWYKFNAVGSGSIKLNYFRDDLQTLDFNNLDVKLFRETIPGDSINGLQAVPLSASAFNNHPTISGTQNWGVGCFSTGTYYIVFTGCNFYKATVTPNIWLEHKIGDYCFDAIPLTITDEDSISVSASVDCWTIGEAPGEDGTNMGCLGSPSLKKSGWYQIFLDNDSIVDLDVSLQENTTASSSDISYRFATGTCDALTYQTCVTGAGFLTLNLKCRIDSFLYVQIVMPSTAEGTIDFTLETSYAQDSSCIPSDPDIPNANFSFANNCENEAITFTNNSTIGSAVTYAWDFGDGNTSTDFNPVHYYGDSGTYLIRLIVDNSQYTDTSYNLIHVLAGPDGSFSMPQNTCIANPTLISTQGTNSTIASDYYWSFENYTTGTTENFIGLDFTHTFTATGDYKVCFYNSLFDSICPVIMCDTIHVYNDFNDTTYLSSCNYLDTGMVVLNNTSITGCDSSEITITSLNPSINDTLISYTCIETDTNTIVFNGTTTLGCDSIYTEITKFQEAFYDTIYEGTCIEADTGLFVENNTSVYGCDSIITSIFSLNPSYEFINFSSSCFPTDTGTFTVNNQTILGCDSTIITIVNLLPSYHDTITNYSCLAEDTGIVISNNITILGCDSNIVTVTDLSFPNALQNPLSDTTFCQEEVAYVYIDEAGKDFLWSDGTEGTSFSPSIAGIYFVEFTQDGTNCKITDSLTVNFEKCYFNCEIIWPDAFTPNNDFLNDNFKPIRDEEDVEILDFRIYNRWGEMLHNSIEPWNGYYNGQLQEADVYTFYLKYSCAEDDETKTHLGIINLIR